MPSLDEIREGLKTAKPDLPHERVCGRCCCTFTGCRGDYLCSRCREFIQTYQSRTSAMVHEFSDSSTTCGISAPPGDAKWKPVSSITCWRCKMLRSGKEPTEHWQVGSSVPLKMEYTEGRGSWLTEPAVYKYAEGKLVKTPINPPPEGVIIMTHGDYIEGDDGSND